MGSNNLHFAANIKRSPDEVISFVADVRKRATYQASLTSITHIVGHSGAGQTWSWSYELAGHQLEGTGKGVEFKQGKLYVFETEGAVQSRFTYRAEPRDGGAWLTVDVEVEVPPELAEKLDIESLLKVAKQKGDAAIAQFKDAIEE